MTDLFCATAALRSRAGSVTLLRKVDEASRLVMKGLEAPSTLQTMEVGGSETCASPTYATAVSAAVALGGRGKRKFVRRRRVNFAPPAIIINGGAQYAGHPTTPSLRGRPV